MTHKEWIRKCIEECKTCGNLNTASGAERLIEKFAEHMDESGSGLPEGGVVFIELHVTEETTERGVVCTSSHTYREIEQILADGKSPVLHIAEASTYAPLLANTGNQWFFGCTTLAEPFSETPHLVAFAVIHGVSDDIYFRMSTTPTTMMM